MCVVHLTPLYSYLLRWLHLLLAFCFALIVPFICWGAVATPGHPHGLPHFVFQPPHTHLPHTAESVPLTANQLLLSPSLDVWCGSPASMPSPNQPLVQPGAPAPSASAPTAPNATAPDATAPAAQSTPSLLITLLAPLLLVAARHLADSTRRGFIVRIPAFAFTALDPLRWYPPPRLASATLFPYPSF